MDFSMFEAIRHTADMADMDHPEPMREKWQSSNPEGYEGRFPKNTPLAMAYVPCQQWSETYNIEKGVERGTVFPELDLPFSPEEGCI